MKTKYTKSGSLSLLQLNLLTPVLGCIMFLSTSSSQAQFHQNLQFDGVNDVVDCGSMANVFEGASTFTVEARVKFNAFSLWGTVFCKRTSDSARDVVLQIYSSTGQLGVAVSNGYGYTTNTLSPNVWYHIAIVYDGNNPTDATRLKLIVDGVEQALSFLFSPVPPISPVVAGSRFCLGAEYNGTSAIVGSSQLWVPFDGTMDEVRIWSVARPLALIIADIDAELTLPMAGLEAYYQFNQGSSCGSNAGLTALTDATDNSPATLWNFALSGAASNYTTVVDTSVTVNGSTLLANASPATYQWVDCGSQMPISGQIGNTFEPTATGSYAVIVTQGLCVAQSGCYPVVISSVDDRASNLRGAVYPNPNSGDFTVRYDDTDAQVLLEVLDITGRSVHTERRWMVNGENKDVALAGRLVAGSYILRLRNSESRYEQRVVVR